MPEALAKKVLLIGWDAADWAILQPLIDRGLMPFLTSLIRRGVYGKISTLRPILSPMLWNSVATGKRPEKHGIFGFVEPRPDGSGIRPVTSTSRNCKAIWNILSQNGYRSNVVNWYGSYPAEPIKGVVVTDRYCTQAVVPSPRRRVDPAMVHPSALAPALAKLVVDPTEIDAETILSFIPEGRRIDQGKDDRVRKLALLIAKMTTIHAAACKIMVDQPWDFMAVYYDAIDHFGHTFMPYHPPAMEGIDSDDAEIYGQCVTGCYRFHDMMLGAMLHYAGPETTVILVSDHGFHSQRLRPGTDGYKDPVSWHRPYGVVVAAGPGIRENDKLSGVNLLDVTPTVLSLFGLPVGADMDGRRWVEVFDPPWKEGIERIDSWESVPGEDGMHAEDAREDPVAAAAAIRQLVDLGYIEPPDENTEKQVTSTINSIKYNRAMSLTYSRHRDQAVAIWKELISQSDNPRTRLGYELELATSLLRMGEYGEVEQMIQGLSPEQRKLPVVQMLLATLRLHQERGEEALKHLRIAARHLPRDNPQLLAQIGQAYLQTHQYNKAYEQFEFAIAADDENAIALLGLAELSNLRGHHQHALEYALRAIELVDSVPAGHYHLALALAKLNMVEEAIIALENFFQLVPTTQKGRKLLAELQKKQGEGQPKVVDEQDMNGVSEQASRSAQDYLE